MSTTEVDEFLARGMLINTLMDLRMASHSDPLGAELVERALSQG